MVGVGMAFGGPPLIASLGEKSTGSPGSLTAALLGQAALVAVWAAVLIPVKVGIFRDFGGFALIEARRGMPCSSSESQERAQ
jgi:hypothetical protein